MIFCQKEVKMCLLLFLTRSKCSMNVTVICCIIEVSFTIKMFPHALHVNIQLQTLRPFHDFILIIISLSFLSFSSSPHQRRLPDWECAKEYKVQKICFQQAPADGLPQILPATRRDVRQGGLLKHSTIICTLNIYIQWGSKAHIGRDSKYIYFLIYI